MAISYYKVTFVSCCNGALIEFQILTSQVDSYLTAGNTYLYNGLTQGLTSGKCYTYTVDTNTYVNGYNNIPVIEYFTLQNNCQDPDCQTCACVCPEGYQPSEDETHCVKIEFETAQPPVEPLFCGNNVFYDTQYGIINYGSLNNYVWPLLTVPQPSDYYSLLNMTAIPTSGSNLLTGDSWTNINPPAQSSGQHSPIISPNFATPYPDPNPLGLPVNNSPGTIASYPYPLYQSTITSNTLNYGQGAEVTPLDYLQIYPTITNPFVGVPAEFFEGYILENGVWNYDSQIYVEYEWAGFIACLQPQAETTYVATITGNNGLRLFIDDVLAVEMLNEDGGTQALRFVNLFEFTLPPGYHSVRAECFNYAGSGGLAFDIFECSYSQFSAITTLPELVSYRVFSTLWKKARPMTLVSTGTDVVTISGIGTTKSYDLQAFFDSSGFPVNSYVEEVIDSVTYRFNQNIPSGSYTGNLRFLFTAASDPVNAFTCPEGSMLSTCGGLTCVRTLEVPCLQSSYYTLNDCCTQEPIEYQGNIVYLKYTPGDCISGTCPEDIGASIITSITNATQYDLLGCLILTEVEEPSQEIVTIDYSTVMQNVTTVPSCNDCKKIFKLSNCIVEGTPPIFVNNDLSEYAGKTIYLCPSNFPSNVIPTPNPGVPFIVPGDAPQYKGVLTNCCDPTDKRYISNNFSSFPTTGSIVIPNIDSPSGGSTTCWTYQQSNIIGQTYTFANLTGALFYENCVICNLQNPCIVYPVVTACYCYDVEETEGCEDAITLTLPPAIEEYNDCLACRSQRVSKCYTLTDCADPENIIIVKEKDLESFLGKTVKLKYSDLCWQVSESLTCNSSVIIQDVIASFDSCEECLPALPPEKSKLKSRRIPPGYTTPGCSPEYTEKVDCTFSQQALDKMVAIRYGINSCCEQDFDRWDVKKRLLDLKAIDTSTSELLPLQCKCYRIQVLNGDVKFKYISCEGQVTYVTLGDNQEESLLTVCAQTYPRAVCPASGTSYSIIMQADCVNGQC